MSQLLPSKHHRDIDDEDLFPDASKSPPDDELTLYLGGKHKIPLSNADQCLRWWKDHSRDFPVLSLLAKDYLACLATSASVERCFSAAADAIMTQGYADIVEKNNRNKNPAEL
ncbi:hypothetical protein PCASD_11453 [Puccinia coronata f. sp. avenae]|uniref:HAT C-terminal dimerisation domain-containing protein n=1 Tax=Puccinia coronata f. sp. avenae TaxID=200324 RepID=A0A2N5V0R8_9BASI|nr:hypothetical protein PCASD_11453 [Puccinia coronata f. sp. avenae]